MNIGTEAGGPPPRDRGWCVHVEVSLLRIVPRDVLIAWMACEAFQRNHEELWPDNRALAPLMGVSAVYSVKRSLARLEALGIISRRDLGGNRRAMILHRRTCDPLTPGEWAQMELQAEARASTPTPQDF